MNSSEDGRIVVFVVDRDSIAPGNEKVVLEAATTVLDGLGPADAAGVLSLPGRPTDLTRNHARVRTALIAVDGRRGRRIPQSRDYNITWDEAIALRAPRSADHREGDRTRMSGRQTAAMDSRAIRVRPSWRPRDESSC